MDDKEITKYDIAYMDVLCTGVKWRYHENNNIFYFTKDGKTYEFTQTEDVHFIADIDHIRCVIGDQFLPWWKNERIKELESENAALRERLEKSVERLKAREKSVCFGREWEAVVTDEDIDEVFGIAEARLAEERKDD